MVKVSLVKKARIIGYRPLAIKLLCGGRAHAIKTAAK